jgi:hypothetical protein
LGNGGESRAVTGSHALLLEGESVMPVSGMPSGCVMRLRIRALIIRSGAVREDVAEKPAPKFEYSNSEPGSRGSV